MISPSYAHVGGFIIFQLRCLGVADVIDRNILAPCFFFLGGQLRTRYTDGTVAKPAFFLGGLKV
jgi:hypothetical protein